jgi:aromatic ring-opening dioxygenase catalytic subunit (LigB family)
MSRLPTLFIPHGGGPCFFMNWDPPDTWHRMAEYLRRVPSDVGVRKVVTIQNNSAPPLLYDYYGFPESTYQITFPAPGAPEIAARISELLKAANIERTYDHARGFDHGVFIPLKVAFPSADVPIVQDSLLASMDPAEHIRLGQALAPLRDEGVLIIGSGMSYHNTRTLMSHMRGSNGRAPDVGSQRFDDWLENVLTRTTPNERLAGLIHWDSSRGSRCSSTRGAPASASRRGWRGWQRSRAQDAEGRCYGSVRVGFSVRLICTAAAGSFRGDRRNPLGLRDSFE